MLNPVDVRMLRETEARVRARLASAMNAEPACVPHISVAVSELLEKLVSLPSSKLRDRGCSIAIAEPGEHVRRRYRSHGLCSVGRELS